MTDAARRVAVRKLQADADHRKSVALMKFLSGVARKEGVAKHVYVVGGAVRNYLLGVPIKDIDVVVDSVELGRGRDSEWFAKQVADAIPVPSSLVTNQYGVAILTVKGPWELEGLDLQGEVIEIANARKESYEGAGGKGKGYKPTDVAPATIKEDVFRREFTFNTLLWRLLDLVDGPEKAEVIDLTGLGRSHLEEKLISTPVNPDKTFSDDPTRQLRILKFLLRYGLKISPDVAASVKRNAHKLKQMPWEAVANILVRDILDSPRASEGLRVLKSLGMLDVLAEMVAETPPFAAYLNRQLASGNRPVALLLELADVGLSDKAMEFLTPAQKSSFKAVAASLDPEEARKLLDALKRPPIDNSALIQEFSLEGRDRGMLVTVARDVLLADPSALKNPVEFNDRIRDRLRASLPARVASRHLAADNEPTNESLWEKCKATAKARYTKWPSAYAVGHALKLYKDEGGGWKKKAAPDLREARGKAKKDVGHGGLDEWFSGHGEGKSKGEGEATWGDWVAISPVKKKIETELADGTVKTETVYPGDIVGPCGVSEDPNWKDVTKGGKDPLKCMPRQKAHDMDKSERAELAKAKMKAEKSEGNGKKPVMTPTFQKDKEAASLAKRVATRALAAAGKYDDIDFKPPESVADAAKKGLEYREKASPSNKGGLTPAEASEQGIGSGVQRAVNLKNRDNVTPETISKMVGFFARHEKNKGVSPENKGEPWNDKGHVAWLLWGGDPGKSWAEKVKAQMDKADEQSKTAARPPVGPKPASSSAKAKAVARREQAERDRLEREALAEKARAEEEIRQKAIQQLKQNLESLDKKIKTAIGSLPESDRPRFFGATILTGPSDATFTYKVYFGNDPNDGSPELPEETIRWNQNRQYVEYEHLYYGHMMRSVSKLEDVPKHFDYVVRDSVRKWLKKLEQIQEEAERNSVKSRLRFIALGPGGRVRSVEQVSPTEWSVEPTNRQRLDHYVGENYWPDEGDDPEGWDEEGWSNEYANPLRASAMKWLDREFGAGLFDIEVGEKGFVYIELNNRGKAHFTKSAAPVGPKPASPSQISYAKSLIEQGTRGLRGVPAWLSPEDAPTDKQLAEMDGNAISTLIDSLKSRKPFEVERYGGGGYKVVRKASPERVADRFLMGR